ncbi:sensor histidine kinase [Pontibacter cellulosilyticus]|uniref:Histidine kinase n=1 Tax=Pontibacter cellulosilyticus TaxID=1720253 RepID=A0A923N8B6_9BACT|nr:histidine kinase [Pontibacter cellulosilyticus]MBC5993642.1 histidine kinase [Pontibacter cellulosilyticus]
MLNTRRLRFISSLFIAALLSVIAFAASYLEPSGFNVWVFLALTAFLFLIWEWAAWVSSKLDKTVLWSEGLGKRLFLQLFYTCLGALVICNIPYGIYKWYSITYLERPGSIGSLGYVLLMVNGFILFFAFLVTGLQLSLYFMEKWKDAKIEAEQLQKETAKAQLDAIRSQIDPHFLFNNFNTLYGLIQESPKLAGEYLLQLSDIYRYILQHREQEVVPLNEEVELAKSYLFLLQNRYGNALCVDWNLNADNSSFYLPPLTLQMLLENAIKHNSIEEEEPLRIWISMERDGYLEVSNSVKKRHDVHSTKLGLQQLQQRLSYLTDKAMQVTDDLQLFKVSVPLLTLSR